MNKSTNSFHESTIEINQRPPLDEKVSCIEFKNFYWTKKELIQFCGQHQLYFGDGKLEITARIETFLETGVRDNPVVKKIAKGNWDSEKYQLTTETKVIHYKSDPATRAFFKKHIGDHFHFHFNADVLTWIKNKLEQGEHITYGDIIKKWVKVNTIKKSAQHQREIPRQFQYNHFMQAWSMAGEGKGAKEAWKLLRSFPGEATYEHYVELRNQGIL